MSDMYESRESLASYDRLFKQEFTQMVKERVYLQPWSTDQRFLINNLPVPPGIINTEMAEGAYIRGIREPYFSDLNKTVVVLEKRQAWTKKEYDQHGNVLMVDGRPKVKEITIPRESVVVSSKKNIHLPNTKVVGASAVRYEPADGFKYIDFERRKDDTVVYYYAIPKSFVYKLNLCSLVLTKNTRGRQSHYKGYRIVMQNGSYIYLYIIPYNKNARACRVLSIKANPNFKDEIAAIINYWEVNGIIFNRSLCTIGDNSNLGYTFVDGDLNVDDFIPYTNSLSDITTNNDEEPVE